MEIFNPSACNLKTKRDIEMGHKRSNDGCTQGNRRLFGIKRLRGLFYHVFQPKVGRCCKNAKIQWCSKKSAEIIHFFNKIPREVSKRHLETSLGVIFSLKMYYVPEFWVTPPKLSFLDALASLDFKLSLSQSFTFFYSQRIYGSFRFMCYCPRKVILSIDKALYFSDFALAKKRNMSCHHSNCQGHSKAPF